MSQEKWDSADKLASKNRNEMLQRASIQGSFAEVKVLLDEGANPYEQNRIGYSALELAIVHDYQDIIAQMLANSKVQPTNNISFAINTAAQKNHTELVLTLINIVDKQYVKGAVSNGVRRGKSTLAYAVGFNNTKLVIELLACGADLAISHQSVFYELNRCSNPAIVNALFEKIPSQNSMQVQVIVDDLIETKNTSLLLKLLKQVSREVLSTINLDNALSFILSQIPFSSLDKNSESKSSENDFKVAIVLIKLGANLFIESNLKLIRFLAFQKFVLDAPMNPNPSIGRVIQWAAGLNHDFEFVESLCRKAEKEFGAGYLKTYCSKSINIASQNAILCGRLEHTLADKCLEYLLSIGANPLAGDEGASFLVDLIMWAYSQNNIDVIPALFQKIITNAPERLHNKHIQRLPYEFTGFFWGEFDALDSMLRNYSNNNTIEEKWIYLASAYVKLKVAHPKSAKAIYTLFERAFGEQRLKEYKISHELTTTTTALDSMIKTYFATLNGKSLSVSSKDEMFAVEPLPDTTVKQETVVYRQNNPHTFLSSTPPDTLEDGLGMRRRKPLAGNAATEMRSLDKS